MIRLPRRRGTVDRRDKILLAGLLMWLSLYGGPAYADTQAISGILSPFDLTDSHGIHISQFALNINMGNAVTSTWKMMITPMLIGAWACYSWSIGLIAWLLDWTLGMEWATYITSAFNAASSAIRGNLLTPIGATSYSGGIITTFLAIAAISVALTMHRRGNGSALIAALWVSLAASLAMGTFALPVSTFVGGEQLATPVQYARGLTIESMAAINGQQPPADAGNAPLPADMKPSQVLIDAFVRLPHQEYNYGAELDGSKCEKAYDDALKKGPVEASSDKIRSAVGSCDGKYKKYADNPDFWWFFVQVMFGLTGWAVSFVVGIVLILMWRTIMTMSWAAFKASYNALAAIVSPAAWGPLVNDLVGIGVGLVQIVTTPIVLTIGLRMIKVIFTTGDNQSSALQSISLGAKFMAADAALIALAALLIHNHRQNKQWGHKLWRKLVERTPAPNVSQGKGLVLKSLIGGEVARRAWQAYRSHSPRPITPGPGTGIASPVMRVATNPTVVSKGLQLAAGAATGGQAAVAIRGASVAAKTISRYRAVTQGQTASGLSGNAMVLTARAHNFVRSQKNKALNNIDDRLDSARTLARTGQPSGTHSLPVSTGSQHVDQVLGAVGTRRVKTRSLLNAGADVVAAARSQAQRRQPVTTGNERLDAILTRAGHTQRQADRVHDFATAPRQATPATPRTQTAVPRRDSDAQPRRGARRAPRPSAPITRPTGGKEAPNRNRASEGAGQQ